MDSVLLAREVNAQSIIEGKSFSNSLILGPAMIAVLERIDIRGCTWETPTGFGLNDLLLEVPEGRKLIGVVGLRNVEFENCVFRNVGVIGPKQAIDFFKTGISGTDVSVSS